MSDHKPPWLKQEEARLDRDRRLEASLDRVARCARDVVERWDAQGEAAQTREDDYEFKVVFENLRSALDSLSDVSRHQEGEGTA